MTHDAIVPWDVRCARRIRIPSGVIPRESGASSTHRFGMSTPPLNSGGYWMLRFHPKSALADFGSYYASEIGNIRFRGA
jgi:hypothetical protein